MAPVGVAAGGHGVLAGGALARPAAGPRGCVADGASRRRRAAGCRGVADVCPLCGVWETSWHRMWECTRCWDARGRWRAPLRGCRLVRPLATGNLPMDADLWDARFPRMGVWSMPAAILVDEVGAVVTTFAQAVARLDCDAWGDHFGTISSPTTLRPSCRWDAHRRGRLSGGGPKSRPSPSF